MAAEHRIVGLARFRCQGPGSGGRGGFTLLEILVALIVIAAVATVVLPEVIGRLNSGESAALARNLRSLADAMQSFRKDVGVYPSRLSDLSTPPTAASTDLCGYTIPSSDVAQWRGPYVDRSLVSTGLVTGSAVIAGTIQRDPASVTAQAFGTARISATGVARSVAERLEQAYDGDASFTTGTIRWTATTSAGPGTLTYNMPIRGC